MTDLPYSTQADEVAFEMARNALHAATSRPRIPTISPRTRSEAFHTADGSLWVDATYAVDGVHLHWTFKVPGNVPEVKTRREAVAIIERHIQERSAPSGWEALRGESQSALCPWSSTAMRESEAVS